MSHAITAVPPTAPRPVVEATTPIVLIDGSLVPQLQVVQFTATLVHDASQARLAWVAAGSSEPPIPRGQRVTVLVPHMLHDGEVRWQVLLSGELHAAETERAAGKDRRQYAVVDQLVSILDAPADSLSDWLGESPTARELLERVALWVSGQVVFACDTAPLDEPIPASSFRDETTGSVLGRVLSAAGLRLQQSIDLDGDQARRTLTVLPERSGRRIALPWPDGNGVGGAVVSIDAEAGQQPPRRWIARGDRPVVEDTLELVHGWDPALAGEADDTYGRLTSADFSRYGSVYRAWVLNEDGAFTGPPFNQGPAFDVGALFDSSASSINPLRFGDCLTRDAAGRPIPPVIESSTDSGATWSVYPGRAEVMTDRAGMLLTDDTLPASTLAAAQAGTLRVRVTASLTGPDPIEAQRWDGNPFAGPGPSRLLRWGGRFAWRRVAPGSLHADAIDAQQLTADTADDRVALRAALQEQVARSPGPAIRATVELAGAWTALRVGDCAAGVLGRSIAIDGTPTVFDPRSARIRDLSIEFGVSGSAPNTRIGFD